MGIFAMESETKRYEITYLIAPNIPEDEVFGQAGKITGFVQDARGAVGRIEEPKKRRLAYSVGKFHEAYVGWTTFAVAPERVSEIEKRMAAEPAIIRYLIAEEIKRPTVEFRPRSSGWRSSERPLSTTPSQPSAERIEGFTPAVPKEEDRAKIEELDKQLEEVLGK